MATGHLDAWRKAITEMSAAVTHAQEAMRGRDRKRQREAERRLREATVAHDAAREAYYAAIRESRTD